MQILGQRKFTVSLHVKVKQLVVHKECDSLCIWYLFSPTLNVLISCNFVTLQELTIPLNMETTSVDQDQTSVGLGFFSEQLEIQKLYFKKIKVAGTASYSLFVENGLLPKLEIAFSFFVFIFYRVCSLIVDS